MARERLEPRPELLAGRSVEVAQEAQEAARDLLNRHPGLVDPTIIELIALREGALALANYARNRREGHENDKSSRKPGITIYVTPETRRKVIERCEHGGYPVPSALMEEVTPTMWALRFQTGIYMAVGGGVQFHQETAPNFQYGSYHMGTKPFALDYEEVIRVEGDDNELWQNLDYNWDGTPRVTNTR